MLGIAQTLNDQARAAARALVMRSAGGLFALIGTGFLTVALWMYLSVIGSTLMAAIVIGALYCAVGFGLLALASGGTTTAEERAPEQHASPQPANDTPLAQIAQGFAVGMQAGRSARDVRH